jgi:dihydroorotate dehydrogenase (NAD+) catalytic subunit
MLNAIGLQNVGVDALIREKAPIWATWDVPVIANIAGASLNEYVTIAELLDGVPGIAALELNISCPNVAHGLDFGTDPDMAAAVTQAVSERSSLPLIVKLTPNVTDMRPVATAVAEAGAHALAIMNTVTGLAIDIEQKRPVLATQTGGLSGPAVRSIALRLVYTIAPLVDIPVIGIGGIGTTEDALMFLMAGATAVQVGTANFYNHLAPLEIIAGLESYCVKEGLEGIQEVIGAALPQQAAFSAP